MSFSLASVNEPVDKFTANILRTYLEFPEGEEILGVDLNAYTGDLLDILTTKHVHEGGERYLYAAADSRYDYMRLSASKKFHKIFNAHYKSEAKMTKEAFSLGIVNCEIQYSLYNQIFNSVSTDMFVEPDYEEKARKALQLQTDELNLGDDGLTEEDIAKRDEEYKKRLEEKIKDSKRAFRAAVRQYEQKLALIRDDQYLLARITDRLMPGGILIMFTPKELIDQTISIRLNNQYEDIRVLRPETDRYLENRKCIIIARKRAKNINNKSKGIVMAETKFKPYKEIEEITIQQEPLYKVPKAQIKRVETFRLGPLTGDEVEEAASRSNLFTNYQEMFSQTMTEQAPTAPATLKKGHIMMLLTSGYLHGYIGEGANKHLVKGSATKLSRTSEETDDEGVTSWKEREFYSISVKYLTRDGEFHRLI